MELELQIVPLAEIVMLIQDKIEHSRVLGASYMVLKGQFVRLWIDCPCKEMSSRSRSINLNARCQ